MIIALTAKENNLFSQIDPRFGRCRHVVFYNTDSGNYEVVSNPNIDSETGAGIQTAQLVIDRKARVLITGFCGPNADKALVNAGIRIIVNTSGSVQDAVGSFLIREGIQPGVQRP